MSLVINFGPGGNMQPNPDKIVVYTKVPCGYCNAALRYLQSVKDIKNIEVIDLTGQYDSLRELMMMTKQRTVPQIYIYGQHVGGYDDLRAKDAHGIIDDMLTKNK